MLKMIMKMSVMALCAVLPSACVNILTNDNAVIASKTMADSVYTVTGFTSLVTGRQTHVSVTTGKGYSVKAHVPDNVKDYFQVKKKGNSLIVTNRNINIDCRGNDNSPVLYITMPSLKEIDSNDQSSLTVTGAVDKGFTATASGQSKITFRNDFTTEKTSLTASGQSSMTGVGLSTKFAKVSTSGQADIKMNNITSSGDLSLSSSGQSELQIGSINAIGNVSLSASGQSDLSVNKISAATGSAEASGQSDIHVKSVIGNFSCNSSGQASCRLNR